MVLLESMRVSALEKGAPAETVAMEGWVGYFGHGKQQIQWEHPSGYMWLQAD